jgi:hypothetical protein
VVDAGEKQAAEQRGPTKAFKGKGLAARCFAVLMSEHVYTVGVDFGTLSARAVVARCSDGHIMGSSEFTYPHAVMTQTLAASGEALPKTPTTTSRHCGMPSPPLPPPLPWTPVES